MSKYLSTTQISCPGSLCREERVSHGLAAIPGDGRLSPCAGGDRRPPREVWLNSAPAWEERGWGVQFEPRCDVTTGTPAPIQEGRSEDPSYSWWHPLPG